MILRMAAAIARFFGRIGKDAWNSLPAAGKWLDDIIRWPFSLVFGGGAPLPAYEPNFRRADVVDEFKRARQAAAIKVLGRDIVASVRKFCTASEADRATMDLRGIDAGAMALLFTMGKDELRALSRASDPAIRKFCLGKPHGVYGVPVVGVHQPIPANDSSPRPSSDRRRWKEQAELHVAVENQFKVG